MSVDTQFTKENLDICLKELAKQFRKRNGSKMPAEIILIGGASVLINYGFREMTYDMDAIIQSSGAMRDAITLVGDKLGLPYGWLNTDFIEAIYEKDDLKEFYRQCREMELENKDILVEFQDDYPGVLNGDNLADILRAAREKKNKTTLNQRLQSELSVSKR